MCPLALHFLVFITKPSIKLLLTDKSIVQLVSPYIGGNFGGKLVLHSEAVLAALGARGEAPVKVALQRSLMMNSTTHRLATIQRVRIGATLEGRITTIAHES